jgi:hypothetical protein
LAGETLSVVAASRSNVKSCGALLRDAARHFESYGTLGLERMDIITGEDDDFVPVDVFVLNFPGSFTT